MGFTDQTRNKILFAIPSLESLKDKAKDGGLRVLRPKKFEKWTTGGEDRAMQILALCVLPCVIVVSLVLIVALNEVLSGLFGVSTYNEAQGGIVGWFITAVTGGAFILAAWSWFQWVRTYGFGIFRWN